MREEDWVMIVNRLYKPLAEMDIRLTHQDKPFVYNNREYGYMLKESNLYYGDIRITFNLLIRN